MIAGLKPYPVMKTSGVEWLGEVPAHWEVSRLSNVAKVVNGYPFDSQHFVKGEGTPLIRIRDLHATETEVNYGGAIVKEAIVETGDIIVGMDGLFGVARWRGATALLNQRMCCLRVKESSCAGFIARVVELPLKVIEELSHSTTVKHLSSKQVRRLQLGIPPISEQTAIDRFLDHADRRIRRYIRAKQKLIALLEEQKQAVIHQAVTGRIDVRTGEPYPAYKPSGVEWLREIPKHWESRRFKTVCRIRYGLGQPPPESPNGLPLIRATNVERGRIIDKDLIYVDPSAVPAGREAILKEREIIVVRSGAYTADSAIIPKVYDGAVSGYDMVVTVIGALPEFIAMTLLCTYLRDDQLIIESTRSAQPHLNAEELGSSVLLLPSFSEQTAIVAYLDKTTAAIDTTISHSQHQMELLQAHRTRLIADVVTGKLDVREAAAELPEVDPLAEDDLDGTIHDKENSNLGELNAKESAEEYTIEKEMPL